MISTKTEREAKGRALALSFLMAALMTACLLLLTAANPAHAATTFFVNSTSDRADERPGNGSCFTGVKIVHDDGAIEGECTLRAAIQEANATSGADIINFGILSAEDANCDATTKVCTIRPASQLPRITKPLTINGYTQGDATADTADDAKENILTQRSKTNAVLKIELDGTGARTTPGLTISGAGASNSVIRGLVINRFDQSIGIFLPEATGIKVEGNFIGTDAEGDSDLGNGGGVNLIETGNSTIGGTSPEARNLISGNGTASRSAAGVLIDSGSSGNKVEGNLIGIDKNGTADLGNTNHGVVISGLQSPTNNTTINANTIAFNNQGVRIVSGSTGSRILSNSIFSNDSLGIDLVGGTENANDVTDNDPGDPDTGPNTLQNFPTISSAVASGGSTTIKGNLNSTPNRTFTIQFFSSPGALADPSGFGEGKTFIAQRSVTTNANGNASFEFVFNQSVSLGNQVTNRVTATATSGGGNTSEFSKAKGVGRRR